MNTRVWLQPSPVARPPPRLDDLPDASSTASRRWASTGLAAERLADRAAGQEVSRSNPNGAREFEATLPDLARRTSAARGFAVTGYAVHDATSAATRRWHGCASG